MAFFQTGEEIEALVTAFREKTLPEKQWTHQAHLVVGLWHLKQFDLDDATCRVKSGIVSYNLSLGGQNTGANGYHETMTLFWMDVLHFFVTTNAELSLVDTCNQFLESRLADKTLPFEFYHKETILSPRARARAVQPDKKALSRESFLDLFPLSSEKHV